MKTTRIMAIAALIVTTGLALYVAQAQQVGGRRVDLQRHDLSVAGKPPVTLKVGDVLFIPAGTIHSARNVGTGRAAELATYIVEKGKPLLMLAN